MVMVITRTLRSFFRFRPLPRLLFKRRSGLSAPAGNNYGRTIGLS